MNLQVSEKPKNNFLAKIFVQSIKIRSAPVILRHYTVQRHITRADQKSDLNQDWFLRTQDNKSWYGKDCRSWWDVGTNLEIFNLLYIWFLRAFKGWQLFLKIFTFLHLFILLFHQLIILLRDVQKFWIKNITPAA